MKTKRKGRWLFVIPFVIFSGAIFCLTKYMIALAIVLFILGGVVIYLMVKIKQMDERCHRDSETY